MDDSSRRLTFDTNVLFYAFDVADKRKHATAETIVNFCQDQHARVPLQVLSEFYQSASRKLLQPAEAAEIVARMRDTLEVIPASEGDLEEAIGLHQRAKLQFFDALLLCTASRAGTHVLFSEDMQHGQTYAGVRVVNPFVLGERELGSLLG